MSSETFIEVNHDSKMVDLFSYIEQDYTSEIFKIEVRGLPVRTEHSSFLDFLRKNNIKMRKMKVMSKKGDSHSHAYVTFESEEAREEAIKKFEEIKFKSCTLTVTKAKPSPDPLMLKRRDNEENVGKNQNKKRRNDKSNKATIDENFDHLPEEKRIEIINTQVAALWNIPYEEQLIMKVTILKKVMKNCFYDLLKINRSLSHEHESRDELKPSLDWFGKIDIDTLKSLLIPSPKVNGYRNKCEFNVGADRTVGFRLGLYREGTIKVVQPPTNCPIISEQMHQVLIHFQTFIQDKSSLSGFNPATHEGYWRQIMVRTTRSKQCMISIALYRQELTNEQLETEVIEPIKKHFSDNAFGVCSIFFQVINDRTNQVSKADPELVYGDSHIYENLIENSLTFRISPLSFFQINTDAAEFLYKKIVQLAQCTLKTTVLDICCGTGTIGLCLARFVHKVIGIELNEDAIKDAKFNAQLNKIENIEFHCGRAEKLLSQILNKLGTKNEDVVAILDPPRNGLPSDLIKSIRNNSSIQRLIYVSCEANLARRNFIDLCRPKSRAYNKYPFIPTAAIPVDLFPHTDRCELIILFERFDPSKSINKQIEIVEEQSEKLENKTNDITEED